jgi:hypothetical protein
VVSAAVEAGKDSALEDQAALEADKALAQDRVALEVVEADKALAQDRVALEVVEAVKGLAQEDKAALAPVDRPRVLGQVAVFPELVFKEVVDRGEHLLS